jgi:PAS domain S-box-containing protein
MKWVPVLPVKILLVDDKVANLLVLETILEEFEDHLVRAGSGEDALVLLDQEDFAVILLDVQMPTMSGFETARRVRSHPRAGRTPIMFLTAALDEDFSTEEAYALGAVDFMTKPLAPAVLKAKVAIFVDLYRKTQELALAERDKAAAAMRAKDERLRLILDNTSDYAFILANVRGEVTEWEGGAAAVTGWRMDEAIGQPIGVIFTSEDREAGMPQLEMERAASAGRAPDKRWHLRKDGSRFFGDGMMIGLRGPDGALQGYAKIFRDATAEHLGAVELEAARDRERRAAEDLRQLAADLSEANRRKTEFLAVLAHELRNPLAPIRNGLQIMKLVDAAPPSMVKARDMMDRQLTHLVSLVDDLLDVARITQGKFHLKRQRMELGAAVTAAIEASTPLMEVNRHEFSVRLPCEPLMLDADPTRLAQIFSNLLNNAAKYTAPGGRVDIAVHRDGEDVVVTVKDTGIGLSASAIASVFDMFSQVAGRRDSSQGGLGIGLSLVRSLVELHGGKVGVTSPGEGLGSTFEVRLPLAPAQQPDAVGEPAPGSVGNAGKTYRILVVDDNIDAADSLAVLLQSQGHITSVAYDGLGALALAEEYRPEVVFLDIGMPRMSGYEVAAALRQSPGMDGAVLIALTGWGSQEDRLRSRQAGFDHHLTKPAGPAVLSSLIAGLGTREPKRPG